MTIDRDTYLVEKRSPQLGFGKPVGAIADVYKETNEYCGKQAKTVDTVNLDEQDSGFGSPGSAALKFRCVTGAPKN